MRNSVKTHALGIEVPPLDNPDLVTLGAGAFPRRLRLLSWRAGRSDQPDRASMLPPPPDLATQHAAVARPRAVLDRQERHQIHRHAGLGGAAARRRGVGAGRVPAAAARARRRTATAHSRSAACECRRRAARARDQRDDGSARSAPARAATAPSATRPASALVPVLHGQPAEFIVASLEAYAGARRASGIMQPVARDLEPRRVRARGALLCRRCSRHRGPEAPAGCGRRSRADARSPSRAIPTRGFRPAPGCHGDDALKTYPRLAGPKSRLHGEPAAPLERTASRPARDGEAIMAPIARALSERQIEDVAAYFTLSAQPRCPPMTPAAHELALLASSVAGCGADHP